ncbi:hypothetical protein [Yinghuangia soli]|uniref:Uncharacterized protein n=1 Tax=Yinghuangia soli TaxID=2908204 RepID=A0AA41U9G2_9ACTN|nr:hypothetical protein [Yinghuangia soli]MCF2533834.1 hypothetical protein [Yinghuangia soli]
MLLSGIGTAVAALGVCAEGVLSWFLYTDWGAELAASIDTPAERADTAALHQALEPSLGLRLATLLFIVCGMALAGAGGLGLIHFDGHPG